DSLEASDRSVIDRFADMFDKIPLPVKLLKNFDPTGVIGYFADGLSEIKAKRNEEKLLKTIYELIKAVCIIDQKLGRIDPHYFEAQVIALTEMYFDHSMGSYQLEKIEIFRNAFINSVIDYDRDLDEKENMFNLISSLTMDQIRILKFCYESYRFQSRDINFVDIANELKLTSYSYVGQLCHSLIGKGLLVGMGYSVSKSGPFAGYSRYRIGNYLDHLIKYIIEPIYE
ncbi:MAG: hypothetical protein NTV25_07550, partial [Methanothrix sp.]|nr:hypothetical protein [Methanothrix sp.]